MRLGVDRFIRVTTTRTTGEYCYAPVFTKGDGYIYLNNCNSSTVKAARYDVFKRISWKINDIWLCMTAPSSVTGIGEQSTAEWDYILLRPCVINDLNQQWIIDKNVIYTADKKFRVKDYGWYAYITKDKTASYDHTLISAMTSWIDRVAMPGNMSFRTFIKWIYVTPSPLTFWSYYLQNDSSSASKVPLPLYYNPENGHFAQYYPKYGSFYCMNSTQSSSQEWNWVEWTPCTDKVTFGKTSSYWDIYQLNGDEGLILDQNKNPLRVTRYGTHWGVPYTATPRYIMTETKESPTSNFTLDYFTARWNRYVNGNLGETLDYCPAPGKKDTAHTSHIRTKRSLPTDFKLTEAWITRLWQIAVSTSYHGRDHIAFCGTCLLQTLQMLAELQTRYPNEPLPDGQGYFFNTQYLMNPFFSFRERFPVLTARLESTTAYYNLPYHPGEDFITRTVRIARSGALMLLPQYDWRPFSSLARDRSDMERVIQTMLNTPVGTAWFASIIMSSQTGITAHAQPILRVEEGLIVVPTNVSNMTQTQFTTAVNATNDVGTILNRLSFGGTRTLHALRVYQMAQLYELPLSIYISENNCTGEGEHRRGTGRNPLVSLINQCGSGSSVGRCAIQ
ncbi:DUF1561 family protein [Bartonella bacilliformis]|uniref:DUF1561 family protein n=1 Tax=Bartonella bacilliformis TaxID=774 RepID=UPI0007AF7B53